MKKKRFSVEIVRSPSNIFPKNTTGQVTIFIIVGLLLLLAVALIILVQQEIVTFKPGELIPSQKGKVERFITACINQLGEEALFRLGQQGGYVSVPPEILVNNYVHLRTSPFTVIPYWAYGEETAIPSLTQIKHDVDSYIENNLRTCVFSLGAFQETYDLLEQSEIEANTEIVESKVVFNVRWDIEIWDKAGEKVTEVINHVTESPIKLRRLYDTATRVVEKELRDLKLEDITQDLIALEHSNVPVAGFEVSCQQKQWRVEDVRQTMQDLLRVNIRELQVKGTNVVEFPETLPYYANHYIWDLGEGFYNPDVAVEFQYEDDYPFSFDVSPRSGTLLRSNTLGSGNDLISFFCAQTWKFVYDVSYPVVVTLYDETTDYTFKMAFTVHLVRNIPDRSSGAIPKTSLIFATTSDEQYCDTRNIPMTFLTYELIENTFGVSDREVLADVGLTFNCLQYNCEIGKTEYDFNGIGHAAAIAGNTPYCVGAIVRGAKQGYKDGWTRVVSEPGKNIELELAPLYQVPAAGITLVKHDLAAVGQAGQEGQNALAAEPLADDEVVIVRLASMRRNPAALNEPFHEQNIVFSQQLSTVVEEQQTLDLLAKADFQYRLEVNVLRGEELVGVYHQNWTAPWQAVQDATGMTFHVVTDSSLAEDERFELLLQADSLSSQVPAPEFTHD